MPTSSSLIRFAAIACIACTALASPARAQQPAVNAAVSTTQDSSYRAPASVRGAGPNGATMRCRDGSYPVPTAPDAACETKGGILVRFPLLRTPASSAPRAAEPSSAPMRAADPELPGPTPSRANVVIPAERVPADATLLCRDGSYVRADTSTARCATHGGLKGRLPVVRKQP